MSQSFFGFGSGVELEIALDGQETRKTAEMKLEDGRRDKYYLYLDGETISGKVGGFKQRLFFLLQVSSIGQLGKLRVTLLTLVKPSTSYRLF